MYEQDKPSEIRNGPILRILDFSAYNLMSFTINNRKMPVVVSTPDRAHADFWKSFVNYKGDWIHQSLLSKEELKESSRVVSDKDGKLPNLPIPIGVINREEIQFAPERYQGYPIRKIKYSKDGKSVLCSKPAIPVTLLYQFDCKFDKKRDCDNVLEQLFVKFPNNIAVVECDFGEVWGVGKLHAGDVAVLDSSDLEPGEDNNRAIRKTITFSLYGRILIEPQKFPVARTFKTHFLDYLDGSLLDTKEITIRR